MHSNGEFVTVDEAASLVGLSHWTIRRWLAAGKLTRYKALSRTVVNRAELLALIDPRKTEDKNAEDHRCN